MYRTDYHIHTVFSDGRAEPGEYIDAARALGLNEIGFSEHLTLTRERQKWSIDPARLSEYFDCIESLKSLAGDIAIRIGIEADFLPGREEDIMVYLDSFPFDYVIGSVHYMGDVTVDLGPEFYENRNVDLIFEQYFSLVAEAAATGLFDIIGHPDLVRIYGYNYSGNPEPLYRNLAKALKKYDVAFEINTNGRNKPLGDFYPDRRYLGVFAAEGVPLCINSDAHMPSRIGQHFEEASLLALQSGFREMAIFEKRVRRMMPFA